MAEGSVMAALYLFAALSCAAIAWQPYQRTGLWEWMVWVARDAPYQKGDELKEEIVRIIMVALFALLALFFALCVGLFVFTLVAPA